MPVQDDDKFIVNRGGTDYKVSASDIEGKLQDTDEVLINRGGTDYKVSGWDLREYLGIGHIMPWEGHPGGVYHIKNVAMAELVLTGGPFSAWDIDGTNERRIDKVAIGEELVFVAGSNGAKLFWSNNNTKWEFGEFTDVSKVTSMQSMFEQSGSFKGDISDWDVSNVTDMSQMFEYAYSFNSDISGWNTSNVNNMWNMFHYNYDFNQDIGGWDTSNVTDMKGMFHAAIDFNQNISGWNTSKVADMAYLFNNATSFNQDISGWCVTLIGSEPTGFATAAPFYRDPDNRPKWGTCP